MKLSKLILPLMLFVLVLFGAGVCNAAECPVEVKSGWHSFYGPDITITSIVDTVTIQNIQWDRGNKEPFSGPSLPNTLKFGEEMKYIGIKAKEVKVQTNKGTWTFKF